MVTLLAFYSAIVVDSFISTAQNGVCLSLKSLSAGTKEKLTESKRISNSWFTKEKDQSIIEKEVERILLSVL